MADSFLALDVRHPLSSLSKPQSGIQPLLYLTMFIWIHPILQTPPSNSSLAPRYRHRYAIILVWGHQAAVHCIASAHS